MRLPLESEQPALFALLPDPSEISDDGEPLTSPPQLHSQLPFPVAASRLNKSTGRFEPVVNDGEPWVLPPSSGVLDLPRGLIINANEVWLWRALWSGGYVAVTVWTEEMARSGVVLSGTSLSVPNQIGAAPTPGAAGPIPADSPRVVVGHGSLVANLPIDLGGVGSDVVPNGPAPSSGRVPIYFGGFPSPNLPLAANGDLTRKLLDGGLAMDEAEARQFVLSRWTMPREVAPVMLQSLAAKDATPSPFPSLDVNSPALMDETEATEFFDSEIFKFERSRLPATLTAEDVAWLEQHDLIKETKPQGSSVEQGETFHFLREQCWRRLGRSYTLGPYETKVISHTRTVGRQEMDQRMEQVAQSIAGSASASWGPVSASVNASLSVNTSSTQEVTTSETDTVFESTTVENPGHEPLTVINWQLVDVLSFWSASGRHLAESVTLIDPFVATVNPTLQPLGSGKPSADDPVGATDPAREVAAQDGAGKETEVGPDGHHPMGAVGERVTSVVRTLKRVLGLER